MQSTCNSLFKGFFLCLDFSTFSFTFRILPIHRRKAVVKSWRSNGIPATVSGKFEFLQQTKYDITNIDITIEGLVDAKGYHIHIVCKFFWFSDKQNYLISLKLEFSGACFGVP